VRWSVRRRYRSAAAVSYSPNSRMSGGAPRVELCGENGAADDVVALAERFGIPVIEDGPTARALQRVGLDEEIPERLFEAVAVILLKLDRSSQSPAEHPVRPR